MAEARPQSIEERFISELGEKLDACGIQVILEARPYYDLLEARFPIETSRIGWKLVPNATESAVVTLSAWYGVDPQIACKNFLREQIAIHGLSGKAYWINDSLDLILEGDVAAFEQVFESLLWPNGHIYLVQEVGNWCLNVTFEGDLYFGYAPPRKTSLQ